MRLRFLEAPPPRSAPAAASPAASTTPPLPADAAAATAGVAAAGGAAAGVAAIGGAAPLRLRLGTRSLPPAPATVAAAAAAAVAARFAAAAVTFFGFGVTNRWPLAFHAACTSGHDALARACCFSDMNSAETPTSRQVRHCREDEPAAGIENGSRSADAAASFKAGLLPLASYAAGTPTDRPPFAFAFPFATARAPPPPSPPPSATGGPGTSTCASVPSVNLALVPDCVAALWVLRPSFLLFSVPTACLDHTADPAGRWLALLCCCSILRFAVSVNGGKPQSLRNRATIAGNPPG